MWKVEALYEETSEFEFGRAKNFRVSIPKFLSCPRLLNTPSASASASKVANHEMAQAARLNLRMQKELKLLLTDPPPGASFPFLNADSDFSSLATIHAQIEGPEGSVYDKGTFSIKIQIPERYPFQPPNVTFATPIYHPNIDNGGRICLDILNLPPKGAWQPSLNISTVLTSIGLLLSEPNPDDGLMCDASRECKYNRQVFDQKARAMTEKFAKPGANLGSCSTQYCQSDTNSSTMMEVQGSEKESTNENKDFVSNHKKPCGVGRKLSLESSTSTRNRGTDGDANDIRNHDLLFNFGNHMETKGERKELRVTLDEYNVKYEKQSGTGRKVSLESSVQSLGRDGRNTQNINPKQSQSFHNPQTVPVPSLDLPVLHIGSSNEQQLHQHEISKIGNKRTRSDKHCQVSHKIFSGALDASRPNDGINEEMHVTANLLPSRSHPNPSPETLPMASSFKHKLPCKDSVIGMGNSTINARCNKAQPVSTKLSLGFKASSWGQEKDDRENIVPIQEFPFSNPQTAKMTGISQKLSLGPLIQLQGSNDDDSRLFLRSQNLFPDALQKQHSNQHQSRNIDKGVESQWGESPVAESVIVLDSEDSEDSEEEINASVRSKLSLVRKCMKKRKSCA